MSQNVDSKLGLNEHFEDGGTEGDSRLFTCGGYMIIHVPEDVNKVRLRALDPHVSRLCSQM